MVIFLCLLAGFIIGIITMAIMSTGAYWHGVEDEKEKWLKYEKELNDKADIILSEMQGTIKKIKERRDAKAKG